MTSKVYKRIWFCVYYVDSLHRYNVIARFRFLFLAKFFCRFLYNDDEFIIDIEYERV